VFRQNPPSGQFSLRTKKFIERTSVRELNSMAGAGRGPFELLGAIAC
jgi:hypothetical protein